MGLDTVEIVLWTEEKFGVEMPDEEVTNICTVGEFANYIASKVNNEKGTNISFEEVMPDLLDVLEADYSVPRHKITLDSRFVQDLGFG
ncbi:hypothetical protein [Alteromonas stellipolaris]|uniref:Carrier domain-containing protein n=1 Tax=Alteromonas stellipolaris TaxID=233316 RepID=A0AAW7Z6I4_9ALTE|nr:hypothetical protein [Alteromonas stellipolaris]MDO6579682.1 hypothetical protein [Alteromonas stellipolaris]